MPLVVKTLRMSTARLLAWRGWVAIGIVVLVVCDGCRGVGNVQSDVFKERKVCDVKQRLQDGCMGLASSSSLNRIQCAGLCLQNPDTCLGVVLNDTGSCYFHYDCGALENTAICTAEDALFTGYDRPRNVTSPCQNDGIWFESSKTCLCGPYTSGNFCEILPESCEQLRAWGVVSGMHLVDMNVLGNPVRSKVKCEIEPNYAFTYISYNNGTSNYNATFQEYRDGFYKGEACFWLGLENLRRLTDAYVDELVIIVVIDDVEVKKIYHGFEVEDEIDDYEVDFDSWTHVGNSLGLSIGRCLTWDTKFSSWDRDNDRKSGLHIAHLTGTGWWFDKDDSRFCNLNGIKPLDNAGNLNYVTVEWIDLSLSAYGGDFESTTLYLQQTFP